MLVSKYDHMRECRSHIKDLPTSDFYLAVYRKPFLGVQKRVQVPAQLDRSLRHILGYAQPPIPVYKPQLFSIF